MEGFAGMNDIGAVVEADRAHVWHHLSQHKQYETVDPRVIVEGKGMRVWDAKGKEHLDAVSGGVWTVHVGYGRESIANAVRDQLIKLNYFAGSAGSIPGAVVGAFIIGIAENIIKGGSSIFGFGGSGWTTFSDAFTFALLIIILVVKPTGLLGEKTTDKA